MAKWNNSENRKARGGQLKKAIAVLLLSVATLAAVPLSVADSHSEHGPTVAIDRDQVWRDILAKPSLVVSAVFDGNGRLWQASIRGRHLYVSHSDDRGATLSVPVQVNPEPEDILSDGENRPKILVCDGVVYLSYTQGLAQPMTGDIRFSRSLDGGQHFSAPLTVNDNREIISHRFEAMAVNGKGQVFLAWLDKRDLSTAQRQGKPYRGAAVYSAQSDDGGASFRANLKAADHSCECCRVAMALDRDGTPVILWRQVFGKNTRDHALLKLDGHSALQRASQDGWELDACPHHGPALAIAVDGVYHLAWFTNAPQRKGLFYASSADGGKTYSAPRSFGNYDAQAGHADVLSQGRTVYLTWKEFDGETGGAYLMVSRDGGANWAAPRKVASSADNSDHPFLIGDSKQVYLSWNTLKEGYRLIEVTAP